MKVRHLVARLDVDPEGRVKCPERVRHGVLQAGRILALSGEVDPLTHLNLDFAEHRMDICVVVEEMVPGGTVAFDGDHFIVATIGSEFFRHLGRVPVGERRIRWVAELARRRASVTIT